MKQFTILQLCGFVAIAATVTTLFVTIVSNRELKRDNAAAQTRSMTFEAEIQHRDNVNAQLRLGSSFIVDLALTPTIQNKEFLRFLDSIDDDYLRFRKIELVTDSDFAIYWFSESPFSHDNSTRDGYTPRSLCVLINLESGEMVDWLMGTEGLYSYGRDHESPKSELQRLEWGREDGSVVEYRVLRTGFIEIKPDAE